MISKTEFWSIAHVNQDVWSDCAEYVEKPFDSDMGWFHYLSNKTPNGDILRNNVLYNIAQNDKVYLAHVTTNFDSICESGRLLSSSGCLVGSVYCTPVIKEGKKLRLHNLGEYIFFEETKKFGKNHKNTSLLLIELKLPESFNNSPVGIDYLKLGMVHFSVFSELSYLLSQDELSNLKSSVVYSIKKNRNLLAIFENFSPDSIMRNFIKFYKLYQQATIDLPIFGYFLFEVLCEYIALFQHGKEVERYHQLKELYCANFKNIVFSACSDLTNSFNLGLFHPDFKNIIKYLKTVDIINKDNQDLFVKYLVQRLHYLVANRFYHSTLYDPGRRKKFWQNIEWDFTYLQHQLSPLLGHTIHRLLRNMHRYPHFYFYFDQYKALQVWNYWNSLNMALPYNAILPKGEIGINPANPYLKYRIFTTRVWKENGYSYVETEKELPLVIEPRLAELKMLFMRKKI